ncbi:MAG: hypothetical protein L0212_08030 [Acidobacteria bacterium]|nr:hypothetical protein [Acidobacteriota bacterium]
MILRSKITLSGAGSSGRSRRAGVVFFLLALFVALCAPLSSPAQFVGFVGLQTTQQVALNAVSSAQTSAILRNVGQTSHLLTYTISPACNGASDSIRIFLEGSFDGASFVQISNTGTDPSTAVLFASGYYPVVRANLQNFICGGGGSLTARYSATNAPNGPPTGVTLYSEATGRVINMGTMEADRIAIVATPEGHSGGVLGIRIVKTGGGCTGTARLVVEAENRYESGARNTDTMIVRDIDVTAGGQALRQIEVASAPSETFLITYKNSSGVTGGANCTLLVFLASDRHSNVRHAVDFVFGPRTSAGIFIPDFVVGGGNFVPVHLVRPSQHTVQLTVTGAPATCTFELEGTLDDTAGATAFSLSGSIPCTSSTMFHVVNKPVNFIRGNLTALTGGVSPTVTFQYVGRGE